MLFIYCTPLGAFLKWLLQQDLFYYLDFFERINQNFNQKFDLSCSNSPVDKRETFLMAH